VSPQDSSDLLNRPTSVVVDDDSVETVRRRLLGLGLGEPPIDRLRIILSPLEQPAPLLLPGRGLHEDEHGVRVFLAHGERALDVHLEEHVVAGGEVLVDQGPRGALQVAVHVEPLQEPALGADALELASVEEQVVLTVGLTFAARARGRRDREPEARLKLEELPYDRALADPGGAREDQQDPQGVPPISRSA
jgi:hypothetical protein